VNRIEDTLRASLHAQVERPPMMQDLAERTMTRARGVRRRRTVAAAATTVAALVLTGGGYGVLQGDTHRGSPPPPATRSSAPEPSTPTTASTGQGLYPDVLTDPTADGSWRSLRTADGRVLSLGGVSGRIENAYQAHDGWLLVATITPFGSDALDSRALWLLTPDGAVHVLIEHADGAPALAPGGLRLAWRQNDRLYIGHRTGSVLTVDQWTPAPARGEPIAYTGTAVVLGYSETGGGIDHHDVWLPSAGDYTAGWSRSTQVETVYRPAPDGTLYGLVHASGGGKALCLARLDPAAHLKATGTACGMPLTIDPTALVSPDGRWLAAQALEPGSTLEVAMIDLAEVFDHPKLKIRAVLADSSPADWLDNRTVVISGDTAGDSRLTWSDHAPLRVIGLPAYAEHQVAMNLG